MTVDAVRDLCNAVGIGECHDILVMPHTLAIQAYLLEQVAMHMLHLSSADFTPFEIERVSGAKGVTRLVIAVIQEVPLADLDVEAVRHWLSQEPSRTAESVAVATVFLSGGDLIERLQMHLSVFRPGPPSVIRSDGRRVIVYPAKRGDRLCALHVEKT